MSSLGNKEIMAKNIRYYMESRGVDRNKICDDLGFRYTTFSDWVNAKTYPRIDKIEMMANYFGISKADLVEDSSLSQGYYNDPETAELAEKFRNNSDLRVLFQASADLSPEKMKEAYNYIKFLRDQEKGDAD